MASAVAAIPAMISPGAITRFLERVRQTGTPEKVDNAYLKTLGFSNSNDYQLIGTFKTLGFLDSSGRPTDTYKRYKQASDADAKKVLGSAIKSGYSGLFGLYPDANRRDDEAISNWIRGNTDAGVKTMQRALNTFKVLRDAAWFDDLPPVQIEVPAPSPSPEVSTTTHSSNGVAAGNAQPIYTRTGPDVTINVNLEIAATNDPTIYDSFFAAMKKHLFLDAT
jgi:hypothetical protein